ncbi:GNAT family N-acetyltransferase [Streptomyces tagetis]|uniref:GNAT family N-acetyltransferase n=1 Tax=Streptomyces tagetis TaxID=2820809 RepID=UPI0027DE5578|nr:GNAT family N-acetyltransferase [Streptomyces sp. RG38]
MTFPEARTPPALRGQVRRLQTEAWPEPEPAPGPVHDPALSPLSVLLVDDGRVLAALDVLAKEITHRGHRYAAGGLSTVVTDPAVRHRGHGRHLVTEARRMMAELPFDLALFTCDRPLRGFYESAGWQVLAGTVLVGGTPADPFPSDAPGFDKVTLAGFFSPAARRAQATFAGARVGLYPGVIDRLW